MKSGDWVKINFLGRIKATGEVFDLSREEDARKHNLFDEKKKYGPTLVILGAGFIMPGVEKHILGMKVGEKRSFDVSPSEGAGPRKPELIKVVPVSTFTKKQITPFPGLVLQTDRGNCKVLAVSGGRVRVDYNHPLAGKELSYDVEITELIKTPRERVGALLDYYRIPAEVSVAGKKATVTVDKAHGFVEKLVTETLKKWCAGVDSVEMKVKEEKKPAKPKTAESAPEQKNEAQQEAAQKPA
jgi:FKBP-type peptidyl-prolyl cis-trans isomerase 2